MCVLFNIFCVCIYIYIYVCVKCMHAFIYLYIYIYAYVCVNSILFYVASLVMVTERDRYPASEFAQ